MVAASTMTLGALRAGADEASKRVDADNSEVNKTNNGTVGLSADQQSSDAVAVDATRKIRQALVADKSLSTYAHNVKIIWQSSGFVLKGPVKSDAEKQAVEAIATKAANGATVHSELEVTAH